MLPDSTYFDRKQAEAREIVPQPLTVEKGDIRGMQITTTSPPSTGLIRLGAAARMAGLTPEAMRAALARNEIPVSRLTIGKLTFLRASELHIWLTAPTPSPASADLFK